MNTPVTGATSTSTKPPMKPTTPPPFKISPIDTAQKWMKLMVYGKHGCGKTTLAATAVDVASMGDVLMINAESGTMVIEDNPRVKAWENIDTVPVDQFDSVVKIYEYLSSHVKFRDSKDPAAVDKLRSQEAWLKGIELDEVVEPRRYRTVIIDSLTEVEAYCMYKLLGVHGEFSTQMLDEDVKTAEFKEYKQNNNMVNLLVRAFRDLPMHVIVICGRVYEQDELKQFHYGPQLTGKLRSQVQGYFDIVGYLVAGKAPEAGGEAPRRLYVQPEGKWDAKCRISTYRTGFFDNPTLGSIMKELGR